MKLLMTKEHNPLGTSSHTEMNGRIGPTHSWTSDENTASGIPATHLWYSFQSLVSKVKHGWNGRYQENSVDD